LESLAFVWGGVIIQELAVALVILLVTAFAFAVIGIFFSSFGRTVLVSTVLTYVVALMLTIGLPVLMLISLGLMETVLYDLDNVAWTVEAALMYLGFFVISLSPISAAVGTELLLEEEDAILYYWQRIDSTHTVPVPSFWIIYTVTYLVLGLILLLIAVLRVRMQEKK
jgi:hypothetical protein